VPVAVIALQVVVEVDADAVPVVFSVPPPENVSKLLELVVPVWLKFDTTLADDPAPRDGVVMQLVVVAP
jgi:hypothetical protein